MMLFLIIGCLIAGQAVAHGGGGGGGHGGGGGGGHFGGGGGHFGGWHGGGGYYGGGFYGGFGGLYYGMGYPYGYGYGYGYGYPYYANSAPIVAAAPAYIQQTPIPAQQMAPQLSAAPAQQNPAGHWYFCRESNTYYPYVQSCPKGWEQVEPVPPTP
jgi:hypothetical protein